MLTHTEKQPPSWKAVRHSLVRAAQLLFCLSFLSNLAALALPLYTLQIFDRVLYSNSVETLAMLAVALGIMGIAHLGFDALRRKIPTLLADALNHYLGEHLLLNAIDSHSWQTPQYRQLWSALIELRSRFNNPSLIAAMDTLWSPVFIGVLFLIHPWFGALLLATNGIFLVTAIIQYFTLQPLWQQHQEQQHIVRMENNQLLNNRPAMLSMAMTRDWLSGARGEREQFQQSQQRKDNALHRFNLLTQTTKWLLQAGLPTLGALLLIDQVISPGEMLAALLIGARGVIPFEALIQQNQTIKQIKETLQQLKKALNQPVHTQHSPPTPLMGKIRVNELTIFTEGHNNKILDGLNFSVAPGQVLAIIGPNGVGKSLLMASVLGTHTGTKGGIYFDNCNLAKLNSDWLGEQLGYVPQQLQLPSAKISTIICRHQQVNQDKLLDASQTAGLTDTLLALPYGYDTVIDNSHPISPGLVQRIALARALYGSPQYLFFDEADAFLDHQGTVAYKQVIRQAKSQGKTIIFITQHRAHLALADQVLLLDKGQQIFYDTPEKMDSLHFVKANQKVS